MNAMVALAVGLCVLVGGCNRADEIDAGPAHKTLGRYSGIGIYEAGPLWSKLADQPIAKDPKAAKLSDDQHIIVVVDGITGEVRQCGDRSGFCVAMNPWANGSAGPVQLPVKLSEHGASPKSEEASSAATEDVATPNSR